MKRIITTVLSLLFIVSMCVGCRHEHSFSPATCTTLATCSSCGETTGELLPHTWKEATCEEPKTCSQCGTTEGSALGHTWVDATCTEPKTCTVCGVVDGEALGHDSDGILNCKTTMHCKRCGEDLGGEQPEHTWVDATCTEPLTCSGCGLTTGLALGHTIESVTVQQAATCTKTGYSIDHCSVCGEDIETTIPANGHTPGEEWVIITEATDITAGTRVKKCTVCGENAGASQSYTLTPEEKESYFKNSCQTYTYAEIARDPDLYMLTRAKYTGEVIQVMEDGNTLTLRVSITKSGSYYTYYDDPILVVYERPAGSSRILEDDIVTMWGYNYGLYTYESIYGQDITVPLFYAEYVEIQ